jgi:hypothetical protein
MPLSQRTTRMTTSDTKKVLTRKEKIGNTGISLLLLGGGTLAVLQPDLLADYEVEGGKVLQQLFLKYIWGRVGGSIAILFGFVIFRGTFFPKADELPQEPENDVRENNEPKEFKRDRPS